MHFDEAHRTQTSTGSRLKKTDKGVFTTYGFGHYLRASFPNATYCGFTGTPIDETIAVFGDVVDSYTMKDLAMMVLLYVSLMNLVLLVSCYQMSRQKKFKSIMSSVLQKALPVNRLRRVSAR